MNSSEFKNKTVYLKFLLGEINLYKKPLKVLEYNRHFLTVDQDLDAFFSSDVVIGKNEGIFLHSFPLSTRIPVVGTRRNILVYAPRQYKRSFIEGQGTFEQYLQKFSAKSRSTLKRKVRKFDARCDGEIGFRVYSSLEEMKVFCSFARQVSKKTYQERLFDAGIPDDEHFVDRLIELSQRNACRGYLLFCDGNPIAYIYTPILDGNVHSYDKLGYDPDYSKYSPGTVLQYKVLEYLYDLNEAFVFDFTEGGGEHKSFFSNNAVLCGDIYLLKASVRYQTLIYSHLLLSRGVASLTYVLDKLSLRMKIKRLIRRYA